MYVHAYFLNYASLLRLAPILRKPFQLNHVITITVTGKTPANFSYN